MATTYERSVSEDRRILRRTAWTDRDSRNGWMKTLRVYELDLRLLKLHDVWSKIDAQLEENCLLLTVGLALAGQRAGMKWRGVRRRAVSEDQGASSRALARSRWRSITSTRRPHPSRPQSPVHPTTASPPALRRRLSSPISRGAAINDAMRYAVAQCMTRVAKFSEIATSQ